VQISGTQAVSFVQSQADEELWEELITQSMHNPDMVIEQFMCRMD